MSIVLLKKSPPLRTYHRAVHNEITDAAMSEVVNIRAADTCVMSQRHLCMVRDGLPVFLTATRTSWGATRTRQNFDVEAVLTEVYEPCGMGLSSYTVSSIALRTKDGLSDMMADGVV
jgi:hypothetical protein